MICLTTFFNKTSYHTEASYLDGILYGRVSAERYFQTGYDNESLKAVKEVF